MIADRTHSNFNLSTEVRSSVDFAENDKVEVLYKGVLKKIRSCCSRDRLYCNIRKRYEMVLGEN